MSDKMRSEFEAWAHSENWCLAKDSNGIYIKVYVAFAYQAWQASRAALVVELPISVCRTHVFELKGTHEVGMEHDEYFEICDIKKSLDAAGVKYK